MRWGQGLNRLSFTGQNCSPELNLTGFLREVVVGGGSQILTQWKFIHNNFAALYLLPPQLLCMKWKSEEGNCGTAQSRIQWRFAFHTVYAVLFLKPYICTDWLLYPSFPVLEPGSYTADLASHYRDHWKPLCLMTLFKMDIWSLMSGFFWKMTFQNILCQQFSKVIYSLTQQPSAHHSLCHLHSDW